ncbi:cell division protein FtsQ [Paramesorhizobium deserti]|uniref:Cell division protein FtsQ n=1 Tax=Paramesorhizobium deserti TaxID=1494590 RepID=A0A135HUF3_9HYPH|nr:cell division protein FtsQ/DivIB [Paramesorhizobium deserti]KXF76821.1 cell division protein FtsQ [Paramesorhizobium deserti]
MFALNGRASGAKRAAAMRQASGAVPGAFVLPKFLRKPFRLAVRLFEGSVAIPRHFGTVGVLGFLGLTGLYGMVMGGHTPEVVKATTSTFGFAIEKVDVAGNRETSDIDVLGALALDGETSLIGMSAEGAREAIAALPWVESVDVRKVYPGTVHVAIRERKAFAIWQRDRDLTLIDSEGDAIVPFSGRHAELPLVVGGGAETTAKDFVAQVAAFPHLSAKIRAYIRVADRRWDLLLENGVRVMLPEDDVPATLAAVDRLDQEKGLLSRDILAVDMRIQDRVSVRLTPDAMERREQALKDRDKQLARARKPV